MNTFPIDPFAKLPGGPAFPQTVDLGDQGQVMHFGMSLLDYFAAKAMQAWISTIPDESLHDVDEAGDQVFEKHAMAVAEAAFKYADAMLKARNA